MKNFTVVEFEKALTEGPYTSLGGYPIYFYTSDGAALSFQTAEDNKDNILDSIENGIDDGWRVIGSTVNWEDNDLYDDHTGLLIEAAYGVD